jgi:hypothetical protein
MFTKYDSYKKEDKTIQVAIFDNIQFEYVNEDPLSNLENDFKMFVKIKTSDTLSYQLYQDICIWLDNKPRFVEELNNMNLYHKDILKKEKYIENGKEKTKMVKVKEANLYFGKKKMNAQSYMEYLYINFDEAYKKAYGYSVWDFSTELEDKYKKMYDEYNSRQERKVPSIAIKNIPLKQRLTYGGFKFEYESAHRVSDTEDDIIDFVDIYNSQEIDRKTMGSILRIMSKNTTIKRKILLKYGKNTNSDLKAVKELIRNIGLKNIYDDLDDAYKEVKGHSIFDYLVD